MLGVEGVEMCALFFFHYGMYLVDCRTSNESIGWLSHIVNVHKSQLFPIAGGG